MAVRVLFGCGFGGLMGGCCWDCGGTLPYDLRLEFDLDNLHIYPS